MQLYKIHDTLLTFTLIEGKEGGKEMIMIPGNTFLCETKTKQMKIMKKLDKEWDKIQQELYPELTQGKQESE